MIASSGLAPKQYNNEPRKIAVAITAGAELGLGPMQAIQSLAIINGRPSIYGDGLMALCLSHPDCEDIQEDFDIQTNTATCTVKRRGHKIHSANFSQKDAENAKLWGKSGPWKEYPARMLQMRARGFALRDKFADALRGIITVEEAQDTIVEMAIPELPGDSHVDRSEAHDDPPSLPADAEPAPRPVDNFPTFKFGKYVGVRLDDANTSMKNLEWYREAIEKSINDPKRERFKEDNIAHLEEIDNEIAARESIARSEQGQPQPAPDYPENPQDDMPF
jgi:hypothetical protein